MSPTNSNERLLKILQAPAEKQAEIDRILDGKPISETEKTPLLIGMKQAAKVLGVSRATLWRIINAGRLHKVELLPGSFRLRKADVEALALGKVEVVRSKLIPKFRSLNGVKLKMH